VTTTAPERTSAAAAELSAFLDEALPAFEQQWGSDRGFQARLDWQRRLHRGGWVAPSWPVELGGRGLGVADKVACDLVIGLRKAPTIAGILGVNNVGPTLAAVGTDEQKAHLPRILAGDEIWCQGFSEPEAGSDLASLRMQAVRDGDEYVVNGQKIWTSQGMEATHCQLLVRTDPDAPKHKGISALVVPLDLPGIERRPLRQINGEADFAEVFFEDVRVPVANLLGAENDGWRVTMTTLSHERAGVITVSAMLESEARNLLAEHRRDGDRPLPDALRDEVVQRYVEARVLAMMGENSLALAAAGGHPGAEQSVIKFSWSLLSQRLTETRLAVEGLPALTGEVPSVANSFLGSRASTIAGGTTEVMKNILAERVLGLPKEPK
jgi:alkylation response protein AidB-like acyl-CoA dehydrogenase